MGNTLFKKLDLGHPNIVLANRTHENALQLINSHNASIEHYDDVFESLSEYNIIISA